MQIYSPFGLEKDLYQGACAIKMSLCTEFIACKACLTYETLKKSYKTRGTLWIYSYKGWQEDLYQEELAINLAMSTDFIAF